MSVVTTIDNLTALANSASSGLAAITPIIDVVIPAIKLLWKKFHADHPDATEADFFALLRGEAVAGKAFNAGWMDELGFVQNIDGNWVPKPVAGGAQVTGLNPNPGTPTP